MKHFFNSWGHGARLCIIFIILLSALLPMGGGHISATQQSPGPLSVMDHVARAKEPSVSDIQWFKNEMRISQKYQEDKEGIWGMSWAHFISMVFLIFFFLAALVVWYGQHKQTREILKSLLKEE